MIVATIAFPDERTGMDHLHGRFRSEEDAAEWATRVAASLGGLDLRPSYEKRDAGWVCLACRWTIRDEWRTT